MSAKKGKHVTPSAELFWRHVLKTDDCWMWTGAVRSDGYGKFTIAGTAVAAHRFSWVLHVGAIPKGTGYHGACVLHRCDVRRCVRPDHLFIGTQSENLGDMASKGRARNGRLSGERHPRAKLTAAQVAEIRLRHSRGDTNQSALAREFGVSPQTVNHIVHSQNWQIT